MTKQEKIEEVYGFLSDLIDENGWTMYGVDEGGEYGIEPFGEYQTRNHKDGYFEWRTLELKGIKNNNGWIKIERGDVIPNEDLWMMTNDEIHFIKKDYQIEVNHKFTHYQPIQKPKPPIY